MINGQRHFRQTIRLKLLSIKEKETCTNVIFSRDLVLASDLDFGLGLEPGLAF